MSFAVVEKLVHPFHRQLFFSEAEVAAFGQHEHCPGCGAADEPATLVEIGRPQWSRRVEVSECAACGLVFYRNPPEPSFIRRYYETTFNRTRGERREDAPAVPTRVSRRTAKLVAALGVKDASTRFLDVGCGVGSKLAGLVEAGFREVYGTEMSPYRAAVCQRRFPGRVFEGGWEAVPADVRFDVVYSHHVFEHLPSPRDAFARLTGQLSDRGLVLITVPDAWLEDVAGQVLFLPHLHSFSERSLIEMGRSRGFECLFFQDARPGETSAVFFRDRAHLSPEPGRFRLHPEPVAPPEGGQGERLHAPWRGEPGRRSFYTYLLPPRGGADALRRGAARATRFERAAARGLLPAHGLLHRVGMDRRRRRLGKRGYLQIRHEAAGGEVPVIGADGDRATFFYK